MNACIDRIIQTINILKKNVTINNYQDHEKLQLFWQITKIFGGSPDFMNRASGSFFPLTLHTGHKQFEISPRPYDGMT